MVIGNRVLERRAIAAFHCCGSVCCHPTWTERANWTQVKPLCCREKIDCHMRRAAELARQWPLRAFVLDQNAAKDARSGGRRRQFFNFGNAVKRQKTDAGIPRFCNRAFALDRIAEREPFRRDVKAKTEVNLARTC